MHYVTQYTGGKEREREKTDCLMTGISEVQMHVCDGTQCGVKQNLDS